MRRVCLFCSTGMFTSVLASKIQNVANFHDLLIKAEAFPDRKVGRIIDEKYPDVTLLGPQVKYRYGEIVEKYGNKGIPTQVIDQTDYDMMGGEKVLKSTIKPTKAIK